MKNLIKVLLVVSILGLLLTGCFEDENNSNPPSNNPTGNGGTVTTNEFSSEDFNSQFEDYIGEDKRGESDVKQLILKVINSNHTNSDHLVSVRLEAFKGVRSSTSDESKLIIMSSCIGSNMAIYNVSIEDEDENGTITKLLIKQTEGTDTDPNVPDEAQETMMFDDLDIDEISDSPIDVEITEPEVVEGNVEITESETTDASETNTTEVTE